MIKPVLNSASNIFYRTVYWLPDFNARGFRGPLLMLASFILISVRQIFLPLSVVFLFTSFAYLLKLPTAHYPQLGLVLVVLLFAFFEEIGRLSFITRSNNPVVGAIIFTIVVVVGETLSAQYVHKMDFSGLVLARGGSWIVHIVAGAAYVMRRRFGGRVCWAFIAVLLLHTAFNYQAIQGSRDFGAVTNASHATPVRR